MKVVSLWSGGKDSCFAYYKALAKGYKVCALINFTDSCSKKSLSHGLPSGLIIDQTKLVGVPFFQKPIKEGTYEKEFKILISEWQRKENIKGIVFGDIYLEEHKEWIDRVCKELGVKAIVPLWGEDTLSLVKEFIKEGFEAIIVTTNARLMGKEWLGSYIDNEFIEKIDKDIDPCGEKGEFHTLAVAGPILKGRIDILKSRKILKGDNLHLNILSWRTYGKR